MGNAKRRKIAAATTAEKLQEVVPRISSALKRLSLAASAHLGSDCFSHAYIGHALLKDCGIEAKRVAGYAAWRVGAGDGDVIAHKDGMAMQVLPGNAAGFAYHVWLECGDMFVDFTTYQLKRKSLELDAADGGHTAVDWCPDFLLTPRDSLRSYEDVAQLSAGMFWYEEKKGLIDLLDEDAEFDNADIEFARLLLDKPDMVAIGPNDIFGAQARERHGG